MRQLTLDDALEAALAAAVARKTPTRAETAHLRSLVACSPRSAPAPAFGGQLRSALKRAFPSVSLDARTGRVRG